MTEPGNATGLIVRDVSKLFGNFAALDSVSLEFEPGQVHAVVGHNGSGKSTLMKILSGHDTPTSGTVDWDDGRVKHGAGIASVHQNLRLLPELTALENFGVRAGFGTAELGFVRWRAERRLFRSYCEQVGVSIDPRARVEALLPVEQAAVALAGSLRQLDATRARSKFVLLDEVSTYYNQVERDQLAQLIARLKARDVGVLFVSHYLDEVLAVSDVVSVLRSGRLAATRAAATLTKPALVELMFGKGEHERTTKSIAATRTKRRTLEAEGEPRSLRPVLDTDIRPGEILGLTGRAGMGHEQIPYALFDAFGRTSRWSSSPYRLALVPADRARNGVWMEGTITENVTIAMLRDFRPRGLPLLSRRAERRFAARWLKEKRLGVASVDMRLDELSGGTQQKVLLGRSLLSPIDILVLHEPTQGIDVSARGNIEKTIAQVAAQGTSVVIVSSESDELVDLCDRVLVFHQGVPDHEVLAGDLSERALAEIA